MFTQTTKLTKEVQRELLAPLNKSSIILLIVGSVGLLAYIVLATIFDNTILDLMLIFAVPFALGLVFLLTVRKTMKMAERLNQENIYTFEEEYFTTVTNRNGEQVGVAKIYYKDLVKNRESENYIFMYINKNAAIPVSKSNMTNDELIVLRSLLKLKLIR